VLERLDHCLHTMYLSILSGPFVHLSVCILSLYIYVRINDSSLLLTSLDWYTCALLHGIIFLLKDAWIGSNACAFHCGTTK